MTRVPVYYDILGLIKAPLSQPFQVRYIHTFPPPKIDPNKTMKLHSLLLLSIALITVLLINVSVGWGKHKCQSNSNCGSKEYCNEKGKCVKASCSGLFCDKKCRTDNACRKGDYCDMETGKCKKQACSGIMCLRSCKADNECRDGAYCDVEKKKCVKGEPKGPLGPFDMN